MSRNKKESAEFSGENLIPGFLELNVKEQEIYDLLVASYLAGQVPEKEVESLGIEPGLSTHQIAELYATHAILLLQATSRTSIT